MLENESHLPSRAVTRILVRRLCAHLQGSKFVQGASPNLALCRRYAYLQPTLSLKPRVYQRFLHSVMKCMKVLYDVMKCMKALYNVMKCMRVLCKGLYFCVGFEYDLMRDFVEMEMREPLWLGSSKTKFKLLEVM